MTLNDVIGRINYLTKGMGKTRAIPIEVLLPRCLQYVANNAANNPDQINSLRKEATIAFVSGLGALPANVKHEFLDTLYMTDDPTVSYCRNHIDYVNEFNNSSEKFTSVFYVQGSAILYKNSGVAFTGNRTINVVMTPVLPTLVTDQVDINDNLIQQVIVLVASVLKGDTSLKEIALDYPDFAETE